MRDSLTLGPVLVKHLYYTQDLSMSTMAFFSNLLAASIIHF